MIHFAKWKIILIVVVCALGVLFASPNAVDRDTADSLPGWLPHKQISLGLDLRAARR